jgi:hypothetical protein
VTSDGFPDDKRRLLVLSVGTHKVQRPLSPVEVCDYLLEWQSTGETLPSIASKLQLKDAAMLKKFLRLEHLATDLRPLVDWSTSESGLSFSTAAEIASMPSQSDQIELGKAVVTHKLSKVEVQSVLQRINRGNVPVAMAVEEMIRLRPRITQRYVYIGRLRADLAEKLKGSLHSERDGLLRAAVIQMLKGYEAFGARLGAERWTLVGGKDLEDKLARIGNRLEPDLNDAIASVIK